MERIERGFSSLAGCYALLASLAASFLIYAHLAFLAHPPHWASPTEGFGSGTSSAFALRTPRVLANVHLAALYLRERMHTTRLFFGVFAAVWLACLLWMQFGRRHRRLAFHRREALWIGAISLLVFSVAALYGLGTNGVLPRRIPALVPVSDAFAAGFMLALPLITWSRIRRRHEEEMDAELEDPSDVSARSLARLGLGDDASNVRPLEGFSRLEIRPDIRSEIVRKDLSPGDEQAKVPANRLLGIVELAVPTPVEAPESVAVTFTAPVIEAPEPVTMTPPDPVAILPSQPVAVMSPAPIAVEAPEPIALQSPSAVAVALAEPVAVIPPAEPLTVMPPFPVAIVPTEPFSVIPPPEPITVMAPEAVAKLPPDPIVTMPPEPFFVMPPDPTPLSSAGKPADGADEENHATTGKGFRHDLSSLNRSWQHIEEMRGEIDDWFEQRRQQAIAHIATPPGMRNSGLARSLVQDFPDEKVVAIEAEWAEIRSIALEISRSVGEVPPSGRSD